MFFANQGMDDDSWEDADSSDMGMNDFKEQLKKEEDWRKDNVITQKLNPKYNYEELKMSGDPKNKV